MIGCNVIYFLIDSFSFKSLTQEFPECENQTVISTCETLGALDGVFGECQNIGMNIDQLIDNCIFDYCLEDSMKCAIIGSFANSCLRDLAEKSEIDSNAEICQWANITNCQPFKCPENSSFTPCGDQCKNTKTCGTRNVNKNCPEGGRLVPMCVCDEGYVLENGFCIKEENCGCITDIGAQV